MDLNLPISAIMSSSVQCVSPNQKLVDLKHIYEQLAYHNHIPVVENDVLVGMVSLIDFMRAVSYSSLDDNEKVYQNTLVKDIMSIHPFSLEDSTLIKEIALKLSKGEFHSVVLTRLGKVSGIVTSTDLIRYMLK
jgi:CBS-domain-containing membrane protein